MTEKFYYYQGEYEAAVEYVLAHNSHFKDKRDHVERILQRHMEALVQDRTLISSSSAGVLVRASEESEGRIELRFTVDPGLGSAKKGDYFKSVEASLASIENGG